LAVPSNILIAPLDWGLGHATRCIPVIKYFLAQGCTVRIGASGPVAILLGANFPDLEILPLDGYNIRYSRHRKAFAATIIFQVPKILKAIRREKKWLRRQQERYKFDLVISDNRYGLQLKEVTSVIMTHQLQIHSGQGRVADWLLRRFHYPLLQKFDQCWVVDNPGSNNIGGALSHPGTIPANARYIGLLSQMEAGAVIGKGQQEQILVILSGPEPMRGLLEAELLKQAAACTAYTFILVAGNPGGCIPADIPGNVQYHTYLDAAALQQQMTAAGFVICRSGYSTLMDLAALYRKALLIPTPGQAEQEYLGNYLMKKGLFLCRKQELLDLEKDISEGLTYPGFSGNNYYDGGKLLGEAVTAAGKLPGEQTGS